MFQLLAASPPSPERPTCVPDATRRCILVSGFTLPQNKVGRGRRRCEPATGCHGVSQVCFVCVTTAEKRVTSLGKDWHRPCLKCEKCNKTLSAGSHAEHEGKPYCHNPCYGAMFGPKGFGRGGAESHSFN
uniref:Cysteine-rich protein 2 n=1 Tax=Gasterosteus aculeatus aculeatus TaxID=481459 RepID=G3PB57_GASAC